MRTSTPAARRSSRIWVIRAVSSSCSQMKYSMWMNEVAAGQVLLEARELLGARREDLDGVGRQRVGAALLVDRRRDVGRQSVAVLCGEALPGRGVALVDRAHLGLDGRHVPLGPVPAGRDHLPVPAEEQEEEEADDGQDDQHEEPDQRAGRLAVVVDQQHDDDRPVHDERHQEPPGHAAQGPQMPDCEVVRRARSCHLGFGTVGHQSVSAFYPSRNGRRRSPAPAGVPYWRV